ncbi:MAG: crotonase/enoyl-CoA hydratase family protein [Acidimicrobiales bacterium]
MADTLLIEQTGRTRVITVNRPDVRNAVDRSTAEALRSAFIEFDGDEAADVAILTGAEGNFCAGADLKALSSGDRRPVHLHGPGPMGPTRDVLSKPVIAAVEGYAVAGGLELALWCDLRVAAEDSIFGVFCRRFGVPLVDLGTVRLPRLIGHSRAMDLIVTGRAVGGKEAFEIGLANRITPAGQALEHSIRLADEISRFPQVCMRNDRLSAIEQWGMSEETAARNEAERGRSVIFSEETATIARTLADGFWRNEDPR